MDQEENNPASNVLRAGVVEADLLDTVQLSGYPVQIKVANLLNREFAITEEWSYVDSDSQERRALDIYASKQLYGNDALIGLEPRQPRVRPQLDLLIECKRSELPYVFFAGVSPDVAWDFPFVAGLRRDHLKVATDDDQSIWQVRILTALGYSDHVFTKAPVSARTLSKCVRRGSRLELNGEPPHNSLVLPLLKAQAHFGEVTKPVSTAHYFDFHVVVALAVLDAPMVAVDCSAEPPLLSMAPWVRLLRHETGSDRFSARSWAIDIVHVDFLNEYVAGNLIPFAKRLADAALQHPDELATCEGFASGLGSWDWSDKDLAQRLTRRPAAPEDDEDDVQ